MPPILTATVFTVVAAPLKACPAATCGFVGPNPTPNNSMVSPGFTGRVLKLNAPEGPRRSYVPPPWAPVPFGVAMIPAGYLPLNRLNAGPTAASVTVDFAVPFGVV